MLPARHLLSYHQILRNDGGVLAEYSATELADRSTVSLETASDCSLGSATCLPWLSITVRVGTGWKTAEWSVTETLQSLS